PTVQPRADADHRPFPAVPGRVVTKLKLRHAHLRTAKGLDEIWKGLSHEGRPALLRRQCPLTHLYREPSLRVSQRPVDKITDQGLGRRLVTLLVGLAPPPLPALGLL